jgi:chromosome partitioning protein
MARQANKVIAVTNQKGGVGKTTTSVNLSACLAEAGCSVLLVDMDPQGNATSGLGVDRSTVELSTYDVLLSSAGLEEVALGSKYPLLSIVPCTTALAGAEIELVAEKDREFRLRHAVESMRDQYDFIILDCPPSLGLLTVNALAAATTALVPVQTEYYALEGMGHLLHTIKLVHEHLNPGLTLEGILLTMYDARTNLSEQVAEEVIGHFGDLVFQTIIPRNVRLSEAPSHGESIVSYDRSSRGARSYRDFAAEFMNRNEVHVA